MKKVYELWELMKEGKNGEVFEVIDCVIPSYIGKQVQVYDVQEDAGQFKAIIEPNANNFSENYEVQLVKLYGCLGTAKFKQVEPYKEITFGEAMNLMSNGGVVYVTTASGGMQRISSNSMLKLVDIYHFFELFNSKYFIKGVS